MKFNPEKRTQAAIAQNCGRLIASALRLHQKGYSEEARTAYQGAETLHDLFASKLSVGLTRRLQNASNVIYFGGKR